MSNVKNVFLPVCGLVFSVAVYFSNSAMKNDMPEQSEIEAYIKENYGDQYSVINSTCKLEKRSQKKRCDYTLKTLDADGKTSESPGMGYFWRNTDNNWQGMLSQ